MSNEEFYRIHNHYYMRPGRASILELIGIIVGSIFLFVGLNIVAAEYYHKRNFYRRVYVDWKDYFCFPLGIDDIYSLLYSHVTISITLILHTVSPQAAYVQSETIWEILYPFSLSLIKTFRILEK